MKLIIIAGPSSSGKTAVAKQVIRKLQKDDKISYLKIDVVRAFEDEEIRKEFGIPAKKIYSGDLCPDHAGVMVIGDAIDWAEKNGSTLLLIESAGLCLRCSPYLTQGLGIVTLSAESGMNTPLKMGAMLGLADLAVVTKIDLVSQAEREVFREKIKEVRGDMKIIETNALQGTAIERLADAVRESKDIDPKNLYLKGTPPLGTCTLCVGIKKIGWKNHFGVIRKLEGGVADYMYRGE